MRLGAILAKVSVSDLLALAAAACALYGLTLLHPAAPWIGAALALGFVSIELEKRDARGRES